MIIGITGGIASGKSTLSALLQKEGFPVYNSDLEARRLQDEHPIIIRQTKSLFGEHIYIDGKLDRAGAAALVFKDKTLLKKLTEIVHPVVKEDIAQWAKQFPKTALIFVESAVLFEGGFEGLVDCVMLLTVSDEIKIQRVIKRDGIDKEQILARIQNQIPDAVKALKSDLIIYTEKGLPYNVLDLIVGWQHRIVP